MSKWLERLKREKAEREERRKLKEEKKKEKEKAKKAEQRERRNKRKVKQRNRKAYLKRRKVQLAEKKKVGDVYAWHMIVIMKNNKKVKLLATAWWKTTAYARYLKAIEENRNTVKFPVEITETSETKQKSSKRSAKQKYEIMLLQKVTGNFEENVAYLRDKTGKFVENVIVDNNDYLILAKDDWFIEDTFSVYGYHPYNDRKNFDFLVNEIILNGCDRDNVRRIFVYNNRLIIQYDTDFDFVTCKTVDEVRRLYSTLEKHLGDNKNILFTGALTKEMSSWFLNELEKKTGWSRQTCKRIHTL